MPQNIADLDHIASMIRILTREHRQLTTLLLPIAYAHGSPRERHLIRSQFPSFTPGVARHDLRGSITLTKNRAKELVIEYFDQVLPNNGIRWKGTSRDVAHGMQNAGLLPPGTINRGACVAIGKVLSVLTAHSSCRFFSDVIRHGQPRLFEVWRNVDLVAGPVKKYISPFADRLPEPPEVQETRALAPVTNDSTAAPATPPSTSHEMPPEKVADLLKHLPENE